MRTFMTSQKTVLINALLMNNCLGINNYCVVDSVIFKSDSFNKMRKPAQNVCTIKLHCTHFFFNELRVKIFELC